MSTDLTDDQLVQRFTAGDESALALLDERYRKGIVQSASRLVPREVAEDLYQESLLKAAQSIHTFHGGSFGAWLYQITRNRCINYLRRQEQYGLVHYDDAPTETREDPAYQLEVQEFREKIEREISVLPPRQQTIARLRLYDELKFSQIAERVGGSAKTIKGLFHHARRRLQERVALYLTSIGLPLQQIFRAESLLPTISKPTVALTVIVLTTIITTDEPPSKRPLVELPSQSSPRFAETEEAPQAVKVEAFSNSPMTFVPSERTLPIASAPNTPQSVTNFSPPSRLPIISTNFTPTNRSQLTKHTPHYAPAVQVVTNRNTAVSEVQLGFPSPATTAPSAAPPNINRGIGGRLQSPPRSIGGKIAKVRPAGLAMVNHVGAARDGLGDVVENITLGNLEVTPLPRGEPGGRIVGKGRDIRGVFRFTRVRHNLSDWWADASSLNALTKWLNEKTKIRTDMKVEGGALKLTDANLMKAPLLFMTGHDPALTRSKDLVGRKYGGGRLDSRLSESEAAALRGYLVEKGGFLVFDDCGVNAPAQTMIRLFLAQMRYVMPEYQVERIPNGHEIYHNFYQMGGPPVGFDIFWWGTHPPKRNYLEGISVGDKLSVLIVRRDYMCAMESVSLPTRSVHYSSGIYRFMTNVVLYALTHGSIADYSGYIPENKLQHQKLPTRAPAAAAIGAIE